jgi:drug/metabolite transporter (DMT)-like permease
MSNLLLAIVGALILGVTTRFLYLALNRRRGENKKTTVYFITIFAGTLGGFLLGFCGSITLLRTKWEDGSFLWVFIISYVFGLIGFFGGLFASRLLTRKSS